MDQVTIAGSGVLGSQIAFQCAYKGCDVRIYDIDPAAIARLSQKWRELSTAYRKDLQADDAAIDATDDKTFDSMIAFAERIGMAPIALHKEQPGYVINTLLIPWVRAGMSLVVRGVASPHDVDRTWMIAGGGSAGPFAVLDLVGLRTPLHILTAAAEAGDAAAAEEAKWLRRECIDRNKLGIETGEGFYKYPHPAYRRADFVQPRAMKA
jgi:3-hydroxyacyl-CoA dehydrogenase